jgi:hypothetical protein
MPPFPYDSPEKAQELAAVKNFRRTAFTDMAGYFWQYGAHPGSANRYWNDHVSHKILEYGLDRNPPRASRAYALQSITFFDSYVGCFDAKYAFWAIRPFQLDSTLTTLFPTPNHPSYPGAHGCLSGGAAEILGYLFPREAVTFRALAQEAADSRLWAGIHFRSDNEVGLALGRAVAQAVMVRARADGSE